MRLYGDVRSRMKSRIVSEDLVGYRPAFACVNTLNGGFSALYVIAVKFKGRRRKRLIRAVLFAIPLEPAGHVTLRLPYVAAPDFTFAYKLTAVPALAELLNDPVRIKRGFDIRAFKPSRMEFNRTTILRWLIITSLATDNVSALPVINTAYPGLLCIKPTTGYREVVAHELPLTLLRQEPPMPQIGCIRQTLLLRQMSSVKSEMNNARNKYWAVPTEVCAGVIQPGRRTSPNLITEYQYLRQKQRALYLRAGT